MARPLPVNLLFAGTGSVLLISGLSGKSIAEVLKGDFGSLKFNPSAGSKPAAFTGEGEPGLETISNETPSNPEYSPSTFAPSPTVFSKRLSPQDINKKTAVLLFERGVLH